MTQFHGVCGGHHLWKRTTYKILSVGYYWPSLFVDVNVKVRKCEKCQSFEGKKKIKSLPINIVKLVAPFQQWEVDFIGEIHPPSNDQHRWILIATDYFTKWIEAIPTRREIDKCIIDFLEENILSMFGCPDTIITDSVAAFKSANLIKFCENYGIKLRNSTSYYPHGNGLAEYSNKSMVRIIKKLLEDNKRTWDAKLKYALWANRVSTKSAIGTSPFQLVFGMEVVFP
jgi:hypothetical protein